MDKKPPEPDSSAVRTALWRALHVEVNVDPHILEDIAGLTLIGPDTAWWERQDMHPEFTRRLLASMVARFRFIEDMVIDGVTSGITQYVLLGAGLDTFAQRRVDIASGIHMYEIDHPDTQIWKQRRLVELGFGIPEWLHFVSVDFEESSWRHPLLTAGFDLRKPAVIASAGVSLYLTREAIASIFWRISGLAHGSVLAMTFYLPIESLDEVDKPLQRIAEKGARESGTPFVSFFSPEEIVALARESGLDHLEIVSTADIANRYFQGRTDGFTPSTGEDFLVATV